MKKITYIVYALVAVINAIVGILWAKSDLLIAFFDIPTMFLTGGTTIALLLTHYSPREIIDAFRCAGVAERSNADIQKALLFFRTSRRISILAGIIAFIMGIILMFNLYGTDDFHKSFGVWIGLCVLSILYSLFMIMVVNIPFESALEKKLIRDDPA